MSISRCVILIIGMSHLSQSIVQKLLQIIYYNYTYNSPQIRGQCSIHFSFVVTVGIGTYRFLISQRKSFSYTLHTLMTVIIRVCYNTNILYLCIQVPTYCEKPRCFDLVTLVSIFVNQIHKKTPFEIHIHNMHSTVYTSFVFHMTLSRELLQIHKSCGRRMFLNKIQYDLLSSIINFSVVI